MRYSCVYMTFITVLVKMGMYFRGLEVTCDQLNSLPLKWEYNFILSLSPSDREIRFTGAPAYWG